MDEIKKYEKEFDSLRKYIKIAKTIFASSNPTMFKTFGGNCCRQVAFLSQQFLQRAIPEYRWSIYESKFTSKVGDFEHSWCFGVKQCNGDSEGIFVDLAYNGTDVSNYLFYGKNVFPEDKFLDIVEKDSYRTTMPVNPYLSAKEFYTSLRGTELIAKIDSMHYFNGLRGVSE